MTTPQVKVIQLKESIKMGSEEIMKIVLNPPKAKHLWKFKFKTEYELGELLDIASKLSKQPKSVLEELGSEDAIKVAEETFLFLEPGLEDLKK